MTSYYVYDAYVIIIICLCAVDIHTHHIIYSYCRDRYIAIVVAIGGCQKRILEFPL